VLTQITINKLERCVTTKNQKRQFFFYGRTRIKFWCGLTQIIRNKGQGVLAQITKDNFFSMKGQGQKLVVGRHKSQLTEEKVC